MLDAIRKMRPIIHCITNYVTVNDCANLLLAAGASPLMADEAEELPEITALSKALLLNIGTLNRRTWESMRIAGKTAAHYGIPIVLDPVGAGASRFRTESARQLLQELPITAIKGNASELKALVDDTPNPGGIDAIGTDSVCTTRQGAAEMLAVRYRCMVVQTGAMDVVTDGCRSVRIANGDAMMAQITGSGCMLGALLGAFLAVAPDPFAGVVEAVAMMGIAGEHAAAEVRKTGQGTGSFRTALIDAVSRMTDEIIRKEGRIL